MYMMYSQKTVAIIHAAVLDIQIDPRVDIQLAQI